MSGALPGTFATTAGPPHDIAMRVAITLMLLLCSAASAARGVKVATWDLGWFTLRAAGDPALPERVAPKPAQDIARLRRYAALLDADIVALQGIDGPVAAAALFPPDAYAIHMTGDTVLQRTGFAVRRGIAFVAEPDVTSLDPYPDARLRLRSGAQIAATFGTRTLRLLSVHLKSGCRALKLDTPDRPECATLARQDAALRTWIVSHAAEPFVVLGDFARVMDGADDFWAALAAPSPLERATAGRASPCWGGERFVDHIIAGGPAAAWLRAGSLRVMAYRETEAAWRGRLSEHCPVSVRLDVPD
jgi:endonuclease/exonuclease/phosphatase family metal-dependent hydrolase